MFLNLAGLPAKIAAILKELKSRADVPTSTRSSSAEVAKASVCTEARLSALDDLSAGISVTTAQNLKEVSLTGNGTFARPADMVGDLVYISGCGGGGSSLSNYGAAPGGTSCMFLPYVMSTPTVEYSCPAGSGVNVKFGALLLRGGYSTPGSPTLDYEIVVTPSLEVATASLVSSNGIKMSAQDVDKLSLQRPTPQAGLTYGGGGVANNNNPLTGEYIGAFGGRTGNRVGGASLFGHGATPTAAAGYGGGGVGGSAPYNAGGGGLLKIYYHTA